MRKKLFTLVIGIMFAIPVLAQTSVAVYVTASENVPKETTKIIGSELVAAITRNENYVAVERTDEFLSMFSQEQQIHKEKVDDNTICNIGKKFGASNVCVADITKYGEEYYIVARLLDISTAKVRKTSRKTSFLKSLSEVISASEELADVLVGNISAQKAFSTYAYGDNSTNQSFITRIENRESYTKVSFKYLSVSENDRIGIKNTTYIEDLVTHEKYSFMDATNINIAYNNDDLKIVGKGIWEYSILFDRISEETTNIKIVEPGGREYNDIILKPYGDLNVFVFEDNTEKEYARLSGSYEERNTYPLEFSTYAYGDNLTNQSFITKIENDATYTKVYMKVISASESTEIGISEYTYICDVYSGKKYKLKDASNIKITGIFKEETTHVGKGIWEYVLFFEKIPDETKSIKIIEDAGYNKKGWEYKDITLRPYGQKNLFVFEDNTEMEYEKLVKNSVYYIEFYNQHSDPRNVYLNGKFIGKVGGYGCNTFKISINDFGKLKSVQASGYLIYPNEESFNIAPTPKGQKVVVKN